MLTDFGLSKEGIDDNLSAKSFCGSLAYLAPEMLTMQGHGKSVDWYLLGVLLYEMVVGQIPFYSTNKQQLLENIENAELYFPRNLSNPLKSLILQLMDRDPCSRLGSGPSDAEDIKRHMFFRNIDW
jgi:serine/threonine protein kinase